MYKNSTYGDVKLQPRGLCVLQEKKFRLWSRCVPSFLQIQRVKLLQF